MAGFAHEQRRKSNDQEQFLCPTCKRQQSNVPGLLNGDRQSPLMRSTHSSQPPRHNLAAFRHELSQETYIFVVNGLNLLDAELANLLAAEILATTFAATAWARASSATRTLRPWCFAARSLCSSAGRCYWCACFFSHDAPSQ